MSGQRQEPPDSGSSGSGRPRKVDAVDLLPISDESAFIAAAYEALFSRQADPHGFVDYRFLARNGYTRVELLEQLANSPEAVAKEVVLVNLPGGARPGLLRRLRRFAMVGPRRLLWRLLERPFEVAERISGSVAPEKYWNLMYQTAGSLLERQKEMESLIHVWRREASGRGGDRMEGGRAEAAAGLAAGVERALREFLRPGMVVVDAGSGRCAIAVLASGMTRPGGRVYAIDSAALGDVVTGAPVDLLCVEMQGAGGATAQTALLMAETNPRMRLLLEAVPDRSGQRAPQTEEVLKPFLAAGFEAAAICRTTGALLPVCGSAAAGPVMVWLSPRRTSQEVSR